jgi:hypothetical protein
MTGEYQFEGRGRGQGATTAIRKQRISSVLEGDANSPVCRTPGLKDGCTDLSRQKPSLKISLRPHGASVWYLLPTDGASCSKTTISHCDPSRNQVSTWRWPDRPRPRSFPPFDPSAQQPPTCSWWTSSVSPSAISSYNAIKKERRSASLISRQVETPHHLPEDR